MTEKEKMIPLSVVDALISKLEREQKEIGATLQRLYKIEMLQEIKKEARPSPIPIEPVGKKESEWMDKIPEQSLEQKIKARISSLEQLLTYQMDNGKYLEEKTALLILKLDELRKLLS